MDDFQNKNRTNEDQIAFWNSDHGERWVTLQTGLDAIHFSALQQLIARASPKSGERQLDIGCGAGSSTMALAECVGTRGIATGVDISRSLLNRAEEIRDAARAQNVEFTLADAQTYEFEPSGYDLVASRFGVMFFSEPASAFRNLAGALRSGGRVVFVSWASLEGNPWFEIPRDSAVSRFGPPTKSPPNAPGPFGFADLDYVVNILKEAGFADCWADQTDITLEFPGTAKDAAFLACNVGAATRIAKQYGASGEDMAGIVDDVAARFDRFSRGDKVQIPAKVNYFGAVKL
jgi:SAM-dependent methyltransferase